MTNDVYDQCTVYVVPTAFSILVAEPKEYR